MAISLWQPWASLWGAIGAKRNETRGWNLRYDGPVTVHAAKRWTQEQFDRRVGRPDVSARPRDSNGKPRSDDAILHHP